VAFVGHGLWVLLAAFVRLLSAPGPTPDAAAELAELHVTLRRLARFRAANRLDDETFERLRDLIERRRYEAEAGVPMVAPVRERPQAIPTLAPVAPAPVEAPVAPVPEVILVPEPEPEPVVEAVS